MKNGQKENSSFVDRLADREEEIIRSFSSHKNRNRKTDRALKKKKQHYREDEY